MQTLGLFLLQQLLDWCTQPLGAFSLLQISDLKASYNSQVPPRWSGCPSLKTQALPTGPPRSLGHFLLFKNPS